MRQAEVAQSRARLIDFSDVSEIVAAEGDAEISGGPTIPLTAPISGRILRVIQESETTVVAGQPILEIGDVSNDLEIIAELLSTDAVQVTEGDEVIVENWGGAEALTGTVERVEPWGFTKFSALGVEEQRVNTIIRFKDPLGDRASLGHGYRVEVRIVVWHKDNALTVPSSALFRNDGAWALFVVDGGRARLKAVKVIQNNGVSAAIEEGLDEGQSVILYPGPGIEDGKWVRQRDAG